MENSSGWYSASAAPASSADPRTESLPPARVPRLPAELLPGRLAQLRDLAGRPRGGGDLVTRRDQPGNQVPSQRPGRPRDEDSHELSFRLVLSLEDKAPPEAVTLPVPTMTRSLRLTIRARAVDRVSRRRREALQPCRRAGHDRGFGAGQRAGVPAARAVGYRGRGHRGPAAARRREPGELGGPGTDGRRR